MSTYGSYTYVNGKIEDISDEIETAKIEVTEAIKSGLSELGKNPEDYYYEDVVRQQYSNGDEDNFKYFDDPIFENNVPFVSVAIKAIPRK